MYRILLDNSKFACMEEVYGDIHVKAVSYLHATTFVELEEANQMKKHINCGGNGINSCVSNFKAYAVLERVG